MIVELSGTTSNIHGLIRHPLDIGSDFYRGDDFPQIRRHRLIAAHDLDSLTVNLHLKKVDLLVISNAVVAEGIIPLQKATERFL